MKQIFVNLKRFDVPREMGGVCPIANPKQWIEWIMDESIKNGLGNMKTLEVVYLLPEAYIIPAIERLRSYDEAQTESIHIGCQGVFREDISKGGNFGAFTTNRPAAAAKNLGCTWTMIGHSEERKDKLGIISEYIPEAVTEQETNRAAKKTVHRIINQEVLCALGQDLKVLLCIGETAEEKGEGSFEEQKPRIRAVLRSQLEMGLKGVNEKDLQNNIVIGYEPIWAIGPGKVPPGSEYIAFVSEYIKSVTRSEFGFDAAVVYGGGLKEENAGMIADIDTIDGGLVALTRFTGEIGFYPDELKKIIEKYGV